MPFLGEIKLFPVSTPPAGWIACDGSTLLAADYPDLSALLGSKYGPSNGTIFYLPDLRSRTPVGAGGAYGTGMTGGVEAVPLLVHQIPSHSHLSGCSSLTQNSSVMSGSVFAAGGPSMFLTSSSPNAALAADTVSTDGDGDGHSNIQPYLVLAPCICVSGGGLPL